MKTTRKLFIVYPLLFILILGGMFATLTEYSYAAESFDVSDGTKWVQGLNIDSGLRIKTKDGTVAYCLNQGNPSPSGTYTDKLSLNTNLKAVLYYGYPNTKTFNGTALTADQARCATQLAIWAHDTSGKGNKIDLDKLHGAYDKKPDGDNVLKAAKWLYNKAKSGYSAPSKPSLSSPTITKPADSTPKYFNESYVRIGPYKYTTTNNTYTSNNKISVNLGAAPAGTKIGNSNGTFITTPSAGTDFYAYIPTSSLTSMGGGSLNISVSYDYKYEKAATFTAYKKDSTQNVAVSAGKDYTSGTHETSAKGDFNWTGLRLHKVDQDDRSKVIPDTEFNVYHDPTPANQANNDWVFMYKTKTDSNGVIRIPGIGIGTYKMVEIKPHPDYALNSEIGGSDEMIFKVTNVSTEQVQVMTNKLISVSCEIDKDTIKKTSAAYKSLPNQEGFDNTKSETYRYHVDYRSTSNTWADEFTVDDPLAGVSAGQIRVTELWTPVSHGDYDGKMNLWYKTNKTDEDTDHSNVNAISSNPNNPNNPNKTAVKKNTGYKLWEKDISTTTRTNLKVSNLGLENDEYITGIRLEHGRVEKGFTTRNYSYSSMNDDTTINWTPDKDTSFYTKESAAAENLKPLTYLVMCPEPMTPPAVIENSADVFIARNIHLTDEDEDKVFTEVIDTFKENPISEEPNGETDVYDEKGKVMGKFENGGSKVIKESDVKGEEAKTEDDAAPGLLIMILLGATTLIIILMGFKRKMKIKLLPVFIAGMLMTGIAVSATDDAFAESSSKMVSGKSHSKTVYLKKQAQVDKTEVIKGLDSEDISDLPTSKTFTIRSDKAQDATVEKELKRAGVTLKVSGHDEDGIPNSWDATIVYRGLETYLEKYVYTVEVTPKDRAAKSIPDTRTVASTDKKDYNDLTEEEAVERNQKIVKEKYLQVKNNEVPQKAPVKEPEPESSGWKTADIIKFLGLIAVLSIVSFLIFSALTRRRHKA